MSAIAAMSLLLSLLLCVYVDFVRNRLPFTDSMN